MNPKVFQEFSKTGAMVSTKPNAHKLFDSLVAMHRNKSCDLFHPDGRQRAEGDIERTFWSGYNAQPVQGVTALGSMAVAVAAWNAGVECRRRAGGRPELPEPEKTKPRSIRLNDRRWAKLKSLGSDWLNAAIDEA
jgi:hypothetical protein